MAIDATRIRQDFVPRGNFVAVPLAFPSVSLPLDPDSSRVTALRVSTQVAGAVFGGTSGREAHLFVAALHAPAGYVADLGVLPGATETVRVLDLGDEKRYCTRIVAATNGPAGGQISLSRQPRFLANGIQEWGFRSLPIQQVALFPGERVLDIVPAANEASVLCLTETRLVRVDLAHGAVQPGIAPGFDAPAIPRIGLTTKGWAVVLDTAGALFSTDLQGGAFAACGAWARLPAGSWGWAATADGRLAAADPDGRLLVVDPANGEAEEIGQTLLAPVKAMASLPDGRLYGLCGDGIGRFFFAALSAKTVEDYGPIAAVLNAKRYAYTFACAAVGPDGEIYFGEDDRGGHLWIYYPPLASC